ncbi:hypothetical protein L3Y34_019380 [Caenorhabditis briggsae]|uniref:Uncharacterized protein n=1 Tax=Caenorhabditis briggsae TaxID=6238 RepID=A0AAE9DMP8_CAEBR|nr:hypothetical protein L3Y34_019380 [Caenorhabditis briggsae]
MFGLILKLKTLDKMCLNQIKSRADISSVISEDPKGMDNEILAELLKKALTDVEKFEQDQTLFSPQEEHFGIGCSMSSIPEKANLCLKEYERGLLLLFNCSATGVVSRTLKEENLEVCSLNLAEIPVRIVFSRRMEAIVTGSDGAMASSRKNVVPGSQGTPPNRSLIPNSSINQSWSIGSRPLTNNYLPPTLAPSSPYANFFEGRIVVLGDDGPSAFYQYANLNLEADRVHGASGPAQQSPIGSVVTSVEITPVHSSEGSTAPSSPLNLEGLHLDDEPESPLSSTEGLNGGSGSEADDEGEPQVVHDHMDWEDNV